jgi:site-specific DNA-methyltransferase (adenine-specific)
VIELLNMDCMEYLRAQPDKSFDLAICDPPYGIGFDGENLSMSCGIRADGTRRTDSSWRAKKSAQKYERKTWDTGRPPQDYFDELARVSTKSIIWGGNYFADCLPPSGGWVVWDKLKPAEWSMSDCEFAYCNFGGSIKIFRHLWHGYGKGEPEDRIHPTQKPVKLYKWLLDKYAKPGQRILDTHLGSGSSAIAAHYFGCDFVGCELDKDYHAAAVARFNRETKQEAFQFGT